MKLVRLASIAVIGLLSACASQVDVKQGENVTDFTRRMAKEMSPGLDSLADLSIGKDRDENNGSIHTYSGYFNPRAYGGSIEESKGKGPLEGVSFQYMKYCIANGGTPRQFKLGYHNDLFCVSNDSGKPLFYSELRFSSDYSTVTHSDLNMVYYTVSRPLNDDGTSFLSVKMLSFGDKLK